MYRIYCDEGLLYDPRDEDMPVMEGKVKQSVNATGGFTFTLPPTHPGISRIHKLKSVIKVYDDEELLYEGRVIDSDHTMYNIITYTCEGDMAYLLDSVQHPKEYHDLTPESYLQDKIEQHNSQVDAAKKFTLGMVEKQTMNYSAREDNQYKNTLETIMDKLVNSNGGYLRVRHEEGIRYLDYLESYGRISSQTIRFGENVLDLTEHISAADIITVLIPLGKAEESAGDSSGKRLTIASVNDGKDYLEDEEAIALYGRIVGAYVWEDVTDPATLKRKGREYLETARNLSMTIELTAVDLHAIDVDIDRIKLGDMARVISPPHGLDQYMLVAQREYNLFKPSDDKITLGDTRGALSEKQAALQKNAEKQKSVAAFMETIQKDVVALNEEVNATKQNVSDLDGKIQVISSDTNDTQEMLKEIDNNLSELTEEDKQIREVLEDIITRLKKIEDANGGEEA